MYNLCMSAAKFFEKHRWLYYLLNFTWGIIMVILGLITSLVLLLFKYKPVKFHGIWYFCVGEWWGGIDLGITFVRDKKSNDSMNYHELGHTYQNALLGPFFPFVVGLPSAIRWWYRELKYNRKNKSCPTPYDGIWFEASATDIGQVMKG